MLTNTLTAMKTLQFPISVDHKSAMFFDGVIAEHNGFKLEMYQDGELIYDGDLYIGKAILDLAIDGSIGDPDVDDDHSPCVGVLVDKFFTITKEGVIVDDDLMFNDYDEAIEKFKAGITKDSIPDLIANIEKGIPKMSPAIQGPAKDILGLVGMVNDWVTGQYKGIPWETILTIIAALTYVVSPVDVIPDVVPVAGVIDDEFVITKVLPAIKYDVAKYKEWKSQQGNPQELKRKKRLQ